MTSVFMNIWYISKYAITTQEGFPSRQFMLAKQMAKKGHDVSLFYSRSNGKKSDRFWGCCRRQRLEGVSCYQLNGPLVSYGLSIKRIFSWIIFEWNLFALLLLPNKLKRPDYIIVSSLSLLTFVTGIWLKRKYKTKLILEIRDIWPATIVESGRFTENNIFVKILKKVELLGYDNADAFISPLPKFDLYLRSQISKPFSFKCITQGYDEDFVTLVKTGLYEEYFSRDCFNICYSGTIGRLDYIEVILDVAERLKEYSKIKFLIIGDGPLKKQFIASNTNKNVVFLDSIPKKEVIPVLAKADLLINIWGDLKIYQYGVSPNKWIDYLLSGVPCLVAYNGYRSMLNEAGCGFFVDTNNRDLIASKILELSKMDTSFLKKMGERGKVYAEKHLNYMELAGELLKFVETV